MKKLPFLISLIIAFETAQAGVDTVMIYSKAMHRNVKAVVIKPADYWKNKRFPVVYLLHGAFGNYSNWINKVPSLEEIAAQQEIIIVCPDGANNSWYVDSPADSNFRFETHVGSEVPDYIDKNYKTIPDRKHRAITGLSMGGQGAIFLAFRHSKIFGACGSMSGAFDLSAGKAFYDKMKRLGDTIANAKYYTEWSGGNVIEKYPPDSLSIMVDCGAQDFIFFMSEDLHAKMLKLKIPHDYTVRPGKHDWNYWNDAVGYQMLFFRKFFDKAN